MIDVGNLPFASLLDHCSKEAKLIFVADNRREASRLFKAWEA
jgi:hypothetical protein